MPNISPNHILLFSTSISIFGLLIVLVLAFNPPTTHDGFFWRKPLVGLVFGLVCMFGIFAALFPRQCSHSFYSPTKNSHPTSDRIHVGSHHPDCEAYSAHVVHLGNHTLCAACTGLLVGAIMALAGTAFYVFGGWSIENASLPIALTGAAGTVLGFFQLKFRSFTRLILNMFFVLGAFMILIGTDALTESLFFDLFLIAFIVFWIFTRILLSQWDHWRICSTCKSPCEVRKAKKNWG